MNKNNLALLVLRGTFGLLLTGHGSQKLFGVFRGSGFTKTVAFMEALGLRPGHPWAVLAGTSEGLGGLLTVLGLLGPVGPIMTMGAMSMAAIKVHGGKPIWATEGGAELPLTNLAIATALALTGPGDLSLDRAFKVRLPGWVGPAAFALAAAGLALGLRQAAPPAATTAEQPAPAERAATTAI
jgi:putative oxidoreductase